MNVAVVDAIAIIPFQVHIWLMVQMSWLLMSTIVMAVVSIWSVISQFNETSVYYNSLGQKVIIPIEVDENNVILLN